MLVHEEKSQSVTVYLMLYLRTRTLKERRELFSKCLLWGPIVAGWP